jgi:hypothetical protein
MSRKAKDDSGGGGKGGSSKGGGADDFDVDWHASFSATANQNEEKGSDFWSHVRVNRHDDFELRLNYYEEQVFDYLANYTTIFKAAPSGSACR